MPFRSPEYKDVTYSQLRAFCETARLGGMAAAAEALDVTPPTVWKQLHSLEAHLGMPLVEPHSRGCRLTEAGQLLLKMIGPLIAEVESATTRFQAALGKEMRRLTVAATPRPCEEELLPCVAEYERRFPHVRIVLHEVIGRSEVIETVRCGDADVGVVSLERETLPDAFQAEPLYQLEPVLLAPSGHPLAKKRLRLEHFARFPLLNSRRGDFDLDTQKALERVGAFDNTDRNVELTLSRTVRQYVEHGMGIGIVARPPIGGQRARDVVERSLSHLFPQRMTVYGLYRSHVSADSEVLDFLAVVRELTSR